MTANADDRNTPAAKRSAGNDLTERPVWELAAELGSLAAGIAASTYRFLVLLGEFDAREGWGHYAGVTSSTHWLSWQCGMAAVTAREQVRVARALRTLPLISVEFGAGRLSYSKVRAITRVATPENEAELVQVAEAGTADQVQRFCAGVRTAAGSLAEVNERHDRGAVTYRTLPDGSMSVSVRCSSEQGAVIMDRLQEAQEYLKRTAAEQDESGYSLLDALVLVCEQSEIEAGTSPTRGTRRAETVLHTTLADLAGTPVAANNDPQALIGPRLESGAALHPETARRLACDSGLVTHLHEDGSAPPGGWVRPNPRPGRTVDLGRRRRLPNAALFRAMWDRDHGCVYAGCGRRRYLHGHHLVHWARGGRTDLDNMVLLCGEHHRRLHEGGYQMRRGPDGTICLLDPDGAPVPGPVGVAGGGRTNEAAEGASLVALDGGPLHLAYAVSTVVTNWARRREFTEEEEEGAA